MDGPPEDKLRRFRVLDIETMQSTLLTGYVDGGGRAWVNTGDREERASYVNLGGPASGSVAAYVFTRQLEQDPGLYKFAERAKQVASS